MSDFVMLGFFHFINLDLVQEITEDMEGNITMHFGNNHTRTLGGDDARAFKNEFLKRWPRKSGQAA